MGMTIRLQSRDISSTIYNLRTCLGIGNLSFFLRETYNYVPSGEHTKNYGKSPFLMGKSTISMAIFDCYVSSPEGNHHIQ